VNFPKAWTALVKILSVFVCLSSLEQTVANDQRDQLALRDALGANIDLRPGKY
jgi:hypothetical protein